MRLPALGLLIVVVAAGTAAPALAAPNEIAYRCDVDVCLVDPDAPGAVTNLTDNDGASLDGSPAWSPDGARLAFVSTFGGGGTNLFVMDPDAQGNAANLATQLTFYANDGGYLTDPVWSRDGTKVAFERKASYAAATGVFVVASDGTTSVPVTIAADGAHPTWSPDGSRIAFSRGEQVYVANADGSSGGAPAALANGAGHSPAWSPDGTRIAFDAINPQEHDPFVDLHVVRADGSGPPVVTPITYTQWTFAAWSPDATKLAYRSTTANDGHIRVVGADGSADSGLAGAVYENDAAPSWSPDGARVTFHGYRYSLTDPSVADTEIFVTSATDGSGVPRAITTGTKNYDPVWRPDPLRSPFVPILTPPAPETPAPGAGTPPPGTTPPPAPARRPKVVWITKRIPWTPGNPNIVVGVYGCGGPVCAVATTATATAVQARTAAKNKRKKKPKTIVVGRGHMQVPGGATRPLKLQLTRAGIALLRSRATVTLTVTVTTTAAGRPRLITTKKVRVAAVKHQR